MALAATLLLGPQPEPAPGAGAASEVGHLADPKGLIQLGRTGEARRLLLDRANRSPQDVEAQFLLGMLDADEGAYRDAISRFRTALIQAPDAPRIRLELARAFYLAKDYDNALRQFRLALAGKLPAEVSANIGQFINAIRRDRIWSYQFGFGVAPDTNINGGTSSRETILFGLPFELGADTRRKSGVGLVANAGLEFSPRLSDTVRMRVGGSVRRREYSGNRFDDMTISAQAGPSMALGRWEFGAAVTALSRWYGGKVYQRAIGAKIEAATYPGTQTALTFELAAQHFRYPEAPYHSGAVISGFAGAMHMLSSSSTASLRLGVSRQKARAADLSNWSAVAGLGFTRDFKGGFTLVVEPSVAIAKYDAADPLFATRRRDRAQEISFTLVNRRVMWWRFSPAITYTYSRRRSTIDLYDNTQSRVEFGLSSAF